MNNINGVNQNHGITKVALPITEMETTGTIFIGGNANAPVRPIDIDLMSHLEKADLDDDEKGILDGNDTKSIPSSFGSAERFVKIISTQLSAGAEPDQRYNDTCRELIGLLTVFACRRVLGLNITAHSIDMTNSDSLLIRALRKQLNEDSFIYFCINEKPFAYIFNNCVVPISDRKELIDSLMCIPFFNSETGKFDDILAATDDNAEDGSLLFKQLLFAFLFNGNQKNENGIFMSRGNMPYKNALTQIQNSFSQRSKTTFLPNVHIVAETLRTLEDVLMNAPCVDDSWGNEKVFSDKLLLFLASGDNKPPCFGEVEIGEPTYWCVNPISKELCKLISESGGKIDIVNKTYEVDWDGAPECDASSTLVEVTLQNPDKTVTKILVPSFITCKIRVRFSDNKGNLLTVIILQKRYSYHDYIWKDNQNKDIEFIKMGIDRNVNPTVNNTSIFNRYIVWKCPTSITVSFKDDLRQYEVTHFKDLAHFAIVAPDEDLPTFAFISYMDNYCGCIRFPKPEVPSAASDGESSIFLDFGTTNTICLIKCGQGTPQKVDIKKYVKMITGIDKQFMTFHLLSNVENNGVVKSIGVCSEERVPNDDDILFFAHPLNAGKDAIERSITILTNQIRNTDAANLEKSVGVYTDLKWEKSSGASFSKKSYCYLALAGSLFSSALAEIVLNGYSLSSTKIYPSYPSSMSDSEKGDITSKLRRSLGGLGYTFSDQALNSDQLISESIAAAYYLIKTNPERYYNVGIDIGGGSIDLFSFNSSVKGGVKILPAKIDSVKNAAGQRILSHTLIQALCQYGSDFTECVEPADLSDSLSTIRNSSASDAMCIAETLISEIKFKSHKNLKVLCFKRNVLIKMLAVLIYTAEFAKASWILDEGQKLDKVRIHLCGNGSRILSYDWVGKRHDDGAIISMLKNLIGCNKLVITLSDVPKEETVRGMEKIVASSAIQDVTMFSEINEHARLSDEPDSQDTINILIQYIKEMLERIKTAKILTLGGDTSEDLQNKSFCEAIEALVTEENLSRSLSYIEDEDNGVVNLKNNGDALYKAGVFLRFILDLPFINVIKT